ncbi:MAG: hypothetical protein RL215_1377 [Planctomycetota bacterium]
MLSLGEFVGEAGFEIGLDEIEAGFPESVRGDSGAGQEEFFGHFSEDEFRHEGREGKESWSVEYGAEGFREVEIGGGMGTDEVNRTGECLVFDAKGESTGQVSESDPAPVLATVADDSTGSEFEGKQHFFEGAAFAGEHNTDSSADDAQAEFLCGQGGFFPFAADIGEEAVAFGRFFAEDFVTAVSVEADGGCAYEGLWTFFEGFEGVDDAVGALDAAIADASFEGIVPASCCNIFAGEMNDGIH